MARAHEAIIDYLRLLALHPDYENTPPDLDEEAAERAGLQEPSWGADGDGAQAGASSQPASAQKIVEIGDDEDALAKAMEATKLVLENHKKGSKDEKPDDNAGSA